MDQVLVFWLNKFLLICSKIYIYIYSICFSQGTTYMKTVFIAKTQFLSHRKKWSSCVYLGITLQTLDGISSLAAILPNKEKNVEKYLKLAWGFLGNFGFLGVGKTDKIEEIEIVFSVLRR